MLVPLAELGLLIWMGQAMGFWPTIALVAGTGILGAALARREGTRALTNVQHELARGRVPARALMSGAAVLVGGALLVTPGVLTDAFGIPATASTHSQDHARVACSPVSSVRSPEERSKCRFGSPAKRPHRAATGRSPRKPMDVTQVFHLNSGPTPSEGRGPATRVRRLAPGRLFRTDSDGSNQLREAR